VSRGIIECFHFVSFAAWTVGAGWASSCCVVEGHEERIPFLCFGSFVVQGYFGYYCCICVVRLHCKTRQTCLKARPMHPSYHPACAILRSHFPRLFRRTYHPIMV
jgi:hypothetical protein